MGKTTDTLLRALLNEIKGLRSDFKKAFATNVPSATPAHLARFTRKVETVLNETNNERAKHTLLSLWDLYVDKMKSAGKIRTARTLENYSCYRKNIKAFLNDYGVDDMPLSGINYRLMEEFKTWREKTAKKHSVTGTSRHVEIVRSSLDFAVRLGYINVNPLSALRAERNPTKDVVFLETDELKKIERIANSKTKYKGKRDIRQVADLYLFQAYTGMSYGDLWNFKITEDSFGKWINNKRNKNDTEYWVPLFTEAEKILCKYDGILPKTTNRYYNADIRKVSKEAGIEKYLTTHTARKTFATLRSNEGWSTEAISKMLGHASLTITEKHYLGKTRKRLENEYEKMKFGNNAA